ncbi:MAG: hypothetical protein QHH30_07680 [candidate division NC10 bacterium]|nr:hypothetical protein [candidate division NC10 bacterium]
MNGFISEMLPRTPLGRIILCYFIICFAMVTVPGLYLANHIHPYVLGMPFLLFWCVLWAIPLTTVGLLILYFFEQGEEGRK